MSEPQAQASAFISAQSLPMAFHLVLWFQILFKKLINHVFTSSAPHLYIELQAKILDCLNISP